MVGVVLLRPEEPGQAIALELLRQFSAHQEEVARSPKVLQGVFCPNQLQM